MAFLFTCNPIKKKFVSTNSYEDKIVTIYLEELEKDGKTGYINVLITNKQDSLIEIQKYVYHREGDKLKLSNEFEDNIYTYSINKVSENEILITSSTPSDSLLFNIRISKVKFFK